MQSPRTYRTFVHHEAALRICCDQFDVVAAEIVRQRKILDDYIRRHPRFLGALLPVRVPAGAPEVVRRMHQASLRVGVGPMAAVAGAMAQLAAEAALAAGAQEAIIDNGGDIYLAARRPVVMGLHTGTAGVGDRLAFHIDPAETPLSVCSSSGRMGHSLSLGDCDLATIVAKDAALADAAATEAANLVKRAADIDAALNRIMRIEGIDGVLLVKEDRVGLAGRLPRLIRRRAEITIEL